MSAQTADGELILDMPEEQYHADTGLGEGQFVTRSLLKDYLASPRGFYLRHVAGHPLAQFGGSKATELGTLVDILAEGEAVYAQRVAVWPDEFMTKNGPSVGKPAQAWAADPLAAGMILATPAQDQKARLLFGELIRHPIGRYVIEKTTDTQAVVRWTDQPTRLRCQARIDRLRRGKWLADIKTGHVDPSRFVTHADEYGYDLQAEFYVAGWFEATGEAIGQFIWPYMQNAYPFNVAVIQLPDRILETANIRMRKALEGIAAQDWGPEQREPTIPEPPAWWMYKRESEIGSVA